MPVKIPNALPAYATLQNENIFAMTEERAVHQDIRPLRMLILNLMPTKVVTETQLMRCLSNTPLQIEVDLIQTATHVSRNTSPEHLLAFYREFKDIRHLRYDGMIVTGAPVELLPFEEVDYWDELTEILEWTKTNVYSTLHICWGAQAGLYYHYGVGKTVLPSKMFGVFRHRLTTRNEPLCRGFDDVFYAPHSRHTAVSAADIARVPEIEILAESDESGVYLVADRENRRFFLTGHPEYDADTLANEYFRDVNKGLDIALPFRYFPGDDPAKEPPVIWRSHATLLYTNWLNYYVYQGTPYDWPEKP